MRKKILFVDDNPGMLIVGNMLIKSLGYDVLLAKSGEEAINIIKNPESEIDCMFLDLMMPGVGGIDVLTFMRDSRIVTPVVMQTGLADDSEMKKA